jgi:hypothetical protein
MIRAGRAGVLESEPTQRGSPMIRKLLPPLLAAAWTALTVTGAAAGFAWGS